MRWKAVSALGRRLPEVAEGRTYGARALAVRGSLVARLLDDKKSIVVKVDPQRRTVLCESHPAAFTVTPEVQNYSLMVVRLRAVGPDELWPILVESWRMSGPPGLTAGHDPPGSTPS